MPDPKTFTAAYLFQGTITEGVVTTIRVYPAANLVVSQDLPTLFTGAIAVPPETLTIFAWKLARRSISDIELAEMTLSKPMSMFYQLARNRIECQAILQRLYRDNSWPEIPAIQQVDQFIAELPDLESA